MLDREHPTGMRKKEREQSGKNDRKFRAQDDEQFLSSKKIVTGTA